MSPRYGLRPYEAHIFRRPEIRRGLMHCKPTQGLETAERTKINAIEFKKRIELQDIQVELPIDDPPLHKRESSNISTKTDQDQRARRHQWLKCMDEFADFIRNLEPFGASYQPVNVALIDDGVDMKEKSLYDKLLRGKSFRSSDDEQDRSDSHYVKSGGHGTAMASLICRVCPNAKIMPLKLDEGKGKSKRQIIAESAAEVGVNVKDTIGIVKQHR